MEKDAAYLLSIDADVCCTGFMNMPGCPQKVMYMEDGEVKDYLAIQ